ncbi:MAG: mechanosensitive ion channel [Sulfuricellaceae bacterium]|nr:mechanosensitive ion channel [Sulfuricellaceae bacterium]
MQKNSEVGKLLNEVLMEFKTEHFVLQLAVIAFSIFLAWLATRKFRNLQGESQGAMKVGLGSINRVIFPLTAMLFTFAAREIFRHWGHISLFNIAFPLLASLALVRLAVYMLRLIFSPSGWLKTFERYIAISIWTGVALYIIGLLPEVIAVLESITFSVSKSKISLFDLLSGLLSIVVTLLLSVSIASALERRLMASEQVDMSLRVVFSKLIHALFVLIGVIVALTLAGIDITVLSVFGGALGVGLGLGLKTIASNYLSGFIILLDRSIRIGDMVTIDNRFGSIASITSRYVVVKGQDGTEAVIPNDTLINSTVLNHSYTNHEIRISIPIQISYDNSPEQAMEIMLGVARSMQRVLITPEPNVFLKNFGENGIDLELYIWIRDPEEGQLNLRSEINLAIWKQFKEASIEIPYPQRVIKMIEENRPTSDKK